MPLNTWSLEAVEAQAADGLRRKASAPLNRAFDRIGVGAWLCAEQSS